MRTQPIVTKIGQIVALVAVVGWIVVKGLFHLGIAQSRVTAWASLVMLLVGVVVGVIRWWPRAPSPDSPREREPGTKPLD